VAKKTRAYNADSIEVLKDGAHIRARPGMYVADTGLAGAHQLLREVLSNSVDEYLGGHATRVVVKLEGDGVTFEVSDNGRGIPVDIHPKTKQPALTSILTVAGAGGKFSKDSYKVSAGLHGVGLTVVNALSTSTDVWSKRSGKTWHQRFSRGKKKSTLKESPKRKLRKGTAVRATLDPEIFGPKIKLKVDQVRSLVQATSFLCPGLELTFTTPKGSETFKSASGLGGLLKDRCGEEWDVGPIVVSTPYADVAFGWQFSRDGEKWYSYCNVSPTPEGGSHVQGAQLAISQALQAWSRGSGLSGTDLREGLVGAVHVLEPNPTFGGQSKHRLAGEAVKKQTRASAGEPILNWFKKHGGRARDVVKRAQQIKSAKAEYRKAKSTLSKVTSTRRGSLPSKLDQSPSCKPENRELFLCEGDSAGGTATRARDPKYQEVLPLRGKMPNSAKTSLVKLLENEEMQNILKSIGGGFGPDFDAKKMRVGKVLLLADADPDGCFSGKTRVRLLDGTTPTFEELVKRYPNGEEFWVYSLDRNGKVVPGRAHSPRITKRVKNLFKVELDNGKAFMCTGNHLLAMKNPDPDDGRVVWDKGVPYIRADEVRYGDSLSPLYIRKRERFSYRPEVNRGELLHQLVWKSQASKGDLRQYEKGGYHIHHIDGNINNNSPENLQMLSEQEHLKLHNVFSEYNKSEAHRKRVSELHKSGYYREQGAYDGFEEYNGSDQQKQALSNAWDRGSYNPKFQLLSKEAKYLASLRNKKMNFEDWDTYRPHGVRLLSNITSEDRKKIKKLSRKWVGQEQELVKRTKAYYPMQLVSKFVSVAKEVIEQGLKLVEPHYENKRSEILQATGNRGLPKWDTALKHMKNLGLISSEKEVKRFVKDYNHKVVKVSCIRYDKPRPVYDLTVERYNNFALKSGVFVHNSHITALLISFFLLHMKGVIESGRLWVVDSPLFVGEHGKSRWFGNSKEAVQQHPKAIITRLKGHGSSTAGDLKAYAFDPAKRKLTRVTPQFAGRALEIMGTEVKVRKELLGLD
jgi:DNA gyrase subunit B